MVKHHVQPGPISWSHVDLSECCVSAAVCLCCVWLSCAHVCCQQGLASGADVPHCGAHLPGDRAPSAPACASCLLPWPGLTPGIAADPMAASPGWHCSWATLAWLGSAGGCCSVHYAVLYTTSDLLGEMLLLLFRGKLLRLC